VEREEKVKEQEEREREEEEEEEKVNTKLKRESRISTISFGKGDLQIIPSTILDNRIMNKSRRGGPAKSCSGSVSCKAKGF
jgi:hypothetical protein